MKTANIFKTAAASALVFFGGKAFAQKNTDYKVGDPKVFETAANAPITEGGKSTFYLNIVPSVEGGYINYNNELNNISMDKYSEKNGAYSAYGALGFDIKTKKFNIRANAVFGATMENMTSMNLNTGKYSEDPKGTPDLRHSEFSITNKRGFGISIGNTQSFASNQMRHNLPVLAEQLISRAEAPQAKLYWQADVKEENNDAVRAQIFVGYSPFNAYGKNITTWATSDNRINHNVSTGAQIAVQAKMTKDLKVDLALHSDIKAYADKKPWADVMGKGEKIKDVYKVRCVANVGAVANIQYKKIGLDMSLNIYEHGDASNGVAKFYCQLDKDRKVSVFGGFGDENYMMEKQNNTFLVGQNFNFAGAEYCEGPVTVFVTLYKIRENSNSVPPLSNNYQFAGKLDALTVGLSMNLGKLFNVLNTRQSEK